jgi:tripartite-type tricarboxylate transporter receptor subunit TctC
MVPASTPAAVVSRLHQAILKAISIPDVKERVSGLGADLVGNSPDEFRQFLKKELATWSKVVKEVGMRID